jgi:hypothetical protein
MGRDIRPPKQIQDAYDPYDPTVIVGADGTVYHLKQPESVPAPDAPIATLYVRKGDHAKERTISVNPIPDGIDPMELLRVGFAVDGNSAILSVDPYTFAYDKDVEEGNVERIQRWIPGGLLPGDWATTWSLTKAVSCIERLLVNWLTRSGYQVKFG